MPYRRKDSPYWWVKYTNAAGKIVQRSTGTDSSSEAKKLEAKWREQVFRVKQWGEEPMRTFESFMTPFLEAKANVKKSMERDVFSVKRLQPFFTSADMSRLQRKHVISYIEHRRQCGALPGTINREIGLLSAAYNFARHDLGWRIENPAAHTKLKEPEGRGHYLRPEQVQRLVLAAEEEPRAPHLSAFITLAVCTGCRKGELLSLRWVDVDYEQSTLRIGGKVSKNGKTRGVPLSKEALKALNTQRRFTMKHCPETPWVFANKLGERIQSVQTSFETARRKAGLDDCRVHDLRHTAASLMVKSGVPLAVVRDVLGHSTIKMTERYAHLAPENLRKAVELVGKQLRNGYAKRRA
jgi:integrase